MRKHTWFIPFLVALLAVGGFHYVSAQTEVSAVPTIKKAENYKTSWWWSGPY